jgi:capsular polysaccharide transport system permease protein
MIALSIELGRPLLYFPVVKSSDLVLARSIVEIVTAFWVVALFSFILYVFGVDISPIYIEEAVAAILATILLGVALGYLSAVMYSVIKMWIFVLIVTMILMYVSSGAFFVPSLLPKNLQYWMTWNPLFHSVEWLRSAYYDGYGNGFLDKNYLLGFALVCLFAGMTLERLIRRLVLTS